MIAASLQIVDIGDHMCNQIFLGYNGVDFAVNTIDRMILILDLYEIKHSQDVSHRLLCMAVIIS